MHRFSVVFIEGPVKWLIFGTTRFYNRGTIGDDFAEMRQIRRRNGEGRWNPLDMSNGFHRPLPFPLWILRIFAKSSPIVPRIKKRVLAIFAIFPPKKEIFKNRNIFLKNCFIFWKKCFSYIRCAKSTWPNPGLSNKSGTVQPGPVTMLSNRPFVVPGFQGRSRDDFARPIPPLKSFILTIYLIVPQ